ncbi:MAG: phenylalanine--tRNA ligase subunit beta [Thermodesulfobacteriota bacterium]
MKVPISWLKDYVDITMDIGELAERMTLAGLEVSSIEDIGSQWDREKIFVGEVLRVEKHPNADRLTVVTVDYGAGKPMSVVTGAPNLRVGEKGQKVVFAIAGARLIDGYSQELRYTTLKPSKIRGIPSQGMVCSEKELGLSDEHTGILLLDEDAPVGTPLTEYMGDIVLDLDLTPNLARCFSMVGVAREVAALTRQKLHVDTPEMEALGESIRDQVEVEIVDPDLCFRYSATLIKDVKIGPSPRWIQRHLLLGGMRPINNIVDITNYVMLEWGQPLHAFDYDRLRNRKGTAGISDEGPPVIIVRRAKPGETITTLDGVKRSLTEDMLLITDGGGPVAIAGVMGGFESEVTERTKNILLEAASFSHVNNRYTSQALKLSSEASARFGRGVPASMTIPAAKRATDLMRQLGGGTIAKGVVDVYPVKQEKKIVEITAREVERITGIEIDDEGIMEILEALDFPCEKRGDIICSTVPDHRLDISLPADLVEEVSRIYGYDRIPATLMADELPPQVRNESLEKEEFVRDVMVRCGLQEVITYSITNLEAVGKVDPGDAPPREADYVRLANPLSSEREFMRRTLMNCLLETVRDNVRYTDRVAIFEVGRVYHPVGGEILPRELRRLGIAMIGPREAPSWLKKETSPMDFFDLKGVIEILLSKLGIGEWHLQPSERSTFHPGRAAHLITKKGEAGILGEVHPKVLDAFDLSQEPQQPVCMAELDLEMLLEDACLAGDLAPISRFPSLSEDLAIVVDEDIPAQRVQEVIHQAGGKFLVETELFDLYQGPQVPPGKKSLAYSLTYRAPDKTLTPEDVSRMRDRILRALERELQGRLRV